MIKRQIQIDSQTYTKKPLIHVLDKEGKAVQKIDYKTKEPMFRKSGEPVYVTETEYIQGRLKKINANEITTIEFKDAVLDGKTVSCGIIKAGSRADKDFMEANFLMADIDDGKTFDESLATCKTMGLDPFLMYPTFSYVEGKNTKHRVCFALEEPITDKDEYSYCLKAFVDLFEADQRAINAARLHFGTYNNKEIMFKEDATVTRAGVETLIALGKEYDVRKNTSKRIAKPKAPEKEFVMPVIEAEANEYIKELADKVKWGLDFDNVLDVIALSNDIEPEIQSKKQFANTEEFMHFVKSLPLYELIGEVVGVPFICHFHNDSIPSAMINVLENGEYRYRCFAECVHEEEEALDMFNILSYMLTETFDNFGIVFKWLLEQTSVEIARSAWYNSQEAIIKTHNTFLNEFAKNKKKFPVLIAKFEGVKMKNRRGLMAEMMSQALYNLDRIKEYDHKTNLVFTSSYAYIASKMGTDVAVCKKFMDDLVVYGFIKVYTNEEAKKKFPLQYEASQKLRKESFKNKDKNPNNKQFYTINMYELLPITPLKLAGVELKLKKDKELGATSAGKGAFQTTATESKTARVKASGEATAYEKKAEKELREWFRKTLNKKGYIAKNDFIAKADTLKLKTVSEKVIARYNKDFGAKRVNASEALQDEEFLSFMSEKKKPIKGIQKLHGLSAIFIKY